MQVSSWVFTRVGEPLTRETRDEHCASGEVLVEVSGCGVCHTDLGYYYDGVPTRHALPLVLGHEISGRVVEAGAGAESWLGQAVVVPAVMPCGECDACAAGRGAVCPKQIFPGNDVHGGFGSHVRVPARGLCPVPDGVDLVALSVVADAVSTPYQAIHRSGLQPGDVAVFVGVGGVGGFGVQVAAALGAHVVAIDVEPVRLERIARHGAALTLDGRAADARQLRKQVREFAEARSSPGWRLKIFETSGTPAGQATAFGLLGHGAYLSVVGFTPRAVEVRLSNLMAFDATVQGNWGCLPEHYPAVVELVRRGQVALEPFVEKRPLDEINDVFEALHAGSAERRIVLVPGER